MAQPTNGPFIKTTYHPNGTMTKEPHGFGGGLCHVATAPYEARQGFMSDKTATSEACDPPYLERETNATAGEEQQRA